MVLADRACYCWGMSGKIGLKVIDQGFMWEDRRKQLGRNENWEWSHWRDLLRLGVDETMVVLRREKKRRQNPDYSWLLSKSKGILGNYVEMRFLVGTLLQLSTSHHLPRNFPVCQHNTKAYSFIKREKLDGIWSQVKNMTLCCSL